jgi:hypothetical protein
MTLNYWTKYPSLQERILMALNSLGRAQTKDVVTYLNKEARQIAKAECENGIIDSDQIEKLIIRPSPLRETVARKLSKLYARGTIGKDGRQYFIADKTKENARYVPSTFGAVCLESLFREHFPMIDYLGNNLSKLILIFGVYIVYCFIEAARPSDYFNSEESHLMTKSEKDELTLSYIRQVFDPLLMYKYFLTALKNQPTDKVVEQHRQHLVKDDWFGSQVFDNEYAKKMDMLENPLSTSELVDESTSNLINKYHGYRVDEDPDRSTYELNKAKIKNMLKLIGQLHPDLFNRIVTDLRSSLWVRSGGGTYGDDNIIRPPKETLILGRKRRKRASKAR